MFLCFHMILQQTRHAGVALVQYDDGMHALKVALLQVAHSILPHHFVIAEHSCLLDPHMVAQVVD